MPASAKTEPTIPAPLSLSQASTLRPCPHRQANEPPRNSLAALQVLGYTDLPKDDPSRPADFFDTPPDKDITVCCIVGIKDPVRKEVPGAVRTCVRAGIKVRMVTGDNIHTAQHIARECGILDDNGFAMEGPDFRNTPREEMMKLLPKLQARPRRCAASCRLPSCTLPSLLTQRGTPICAQALELRAHAQQQRDHAQHRAHAQQPKIMAVHSLCRCLPSTAVAAARTSAAPVLPVQTPSQAAQMRCAQPYKIMQPVSPTRWPPGCCATTSQHSAAAPACIAPRYRAVRCSRFWQQGAGSAHSPTSGKAARVPLAVPPVSPHTK